MSNWRRWFRVIHRDVGYITAGLTIIYAVSGIAVNHVDEWNPNYVIEKKEIKIEPVDYQNLKKEEIANEVLKKIGESGTVKNTFRSAPDEIQIFLENNTITANLSTGVVNQEKIKSRTLIRETNYLHLNAPKKVWTYIADLFAIALAFLAVSGLFLIRGKNGIKGRGAWLSLAGLAIPIIFLIIYYY